MSKPKKMSEEELAEGNRVRRMRSYYKHQEEEKKKALDRYYDKKIKKDISGGDLPFKSSKDGKKNEI